MPQTECEKALETFVKHFHASAAKEGDFDTLNKAELKEFITKNFPGYMKESRDPKILDSLFEQVDTNHDNKISFGEIMQFVTIVAILKHNRLHGE